MIPGLNSNVTHAGVEYHIQTEDLGRKNPYVLTLVFRAGAIVAREKINYYRDALGDKAPEAEIKTFMDQQHHRIMRQVMAGQFLAADGLPQAEVQPPPPPPPPPAKPVVLPGADKSLDELIAEYLRSRSATKPR
ncbi:MAG: hypothetical protein AAB254_05135 [candidate division NC10 bacterium]